MRQSRRPRQKHDDGRAGGHAPPTACCRAWRASVGIGETMAIGSRLFTLPSFSVIGGEREFAASLGNAEKDERDKLSLGRPGELRNYVKLYSIKTPLLVIPMLLFLDRRPRLGQPRTRRLRYSSPWVQLNFFVPLLACHANIVEDAAQTPLPPLPPSKRQNRWFLGEIAIDTRHSTSTAWPFPGRHPRTSTSDLDNCLLPIPETRTRPAPVLEFHQQQTNHHLPHVSGGG